MEHENLNKEETANSDLGAVMCSFSKKELDLVCYALTHLNNTNAEYLTWKKDEFSQKEIPKEMGQIVELLHKVHDYRK